MHVLLVSHDVQILYHEIGMSGNKELNPRLCQHDNNLQKTANHVGMQVRFNLINDDDRLVGEIVIA